ncbi:uncharacterized protein LOC133734884 [Rosa rugosa]|uniref:uncharacterized protein LOC133734884 n=1 Tax=Rosa rugosa TaxID=74645 RepID=UPI002B414721|nr:uncharacterized protein LOC133734884 [Rosa rugosa]
MADLNLKTTAFAAQNEEQSQNDVGQGTRMWPSTYNVTEDQEPFMEVKVHQKASFHSQFNGDYIDVRSNPYLMKILQKQDDKEVLFADKVLKFTSTGDDED